MIVKRFVRKVLKWQYLYETKCIDLKPNKIAFQMSYSRVQIIVDHTDSAVVHVDIVFPHFKTLRVCFVDPFKISWVMVIA